MPLKLFLTTAIVASVSVASAQTLYQGVGTGSDLDIDLVGNWNNGLPTSSVNVGTINTDSTVDASAGNFTYTDYFLNLTGGTMSQFNVGNSPVFRDGNFTVNGGIYGTSGGRGFSNSGVNIATINSGSINGGSLGDSRIGASLLVAGGTFQQHGTDRGIQLTRSATLTVSAGILVMDTTGSATGTFGVNQSSIGSNSINLNGGTTTANLLAFGNGGSLRLTLRLTLGGTAVGSATAVNFQTLSDNETAASRKIDWLTGTKMTLAISGADEWAAAEWTANRLFYNGQSSADLGNLSWADATNSSIGVGSGNYFLYNSTSETLSLALIPEPSVVALIAVGLTVVLMSRRRRCA